MQIQKQLLHLHHISNVANKIKKLSQMATLTFKTTKTTGRFRSFYGSQHDIKIKGQCVGEILDQEWKIRIMVIKEDINENGNPNCYWKWITLSKKSESLQEAKQFLLENWSLIENKYKIAYQPK